LSYQIAIDVGGTFTDGVLLDDASDTIWVGKALTTPSDPGEGIARVVEALLAQKPAAAPPVERVVHGTTLITNTLLERKGAATALVVTKGAEDTLDIRREMRYDTYDLSMTFPDPLVAAQHRFPLSERIGPAGQVWAPLPADELKGLAHRLASEDVQAVAICFLHSCVNSDHERAVLEALRRAAPDRSYSISSDVANEIGEYERMSTVVANAYVQPIVESYLRGLHCRLQGMGIGGRLDIMVSNGGFTDADVAARFPIRLLESGPAGGVLSAINCGAIHGLDHIIAFDMGGTTAKTCVSIGGDPAITHVFEFARVRRFKKGSGLPAVAPSIDLIEIGAGGGSIARISALGLLQVGPESAGSEPGPACYGLGGTDATVTDSDLVLGYLDADNFLGGRMKLDVGKAREALAAIGGKLGLSAEQTAWGIHDIVNENMAAAARTHIAEHGHDVRSFTMVATGGAGPVHAVDVARRLRIKRILCPVASGVGSCLGFLAAAARGDRSWSKIELVADFDRADLAARLAKARAGIVEDLAKANVAQDEIRWSVSAEIRYLGQGASVQVDFGDASVENLDPQYVGRRFEEEYVRLFVRPVPGGIPELMTWRVTGQSTREERRYAFSRDANRESGGLHDQREIYLPAEKRRGKVPVYDRHRLAPGTSLAGPLIMVEPESTLVVAYPATVSVLETGTVQVILEDKP